MIIAGISKHYNENKRVRGEGWLLFWLGCCEKAFSEKVIYE